MLPVWNSLICLQSAIISTNALGLIMLDPPLRAMLLGHSHRIHSQFHAAREEFGNLSLCCKTDTRRYSRRLSHLLEILLHRHVLAEVEVILQTVAIDIPHAVEIAGGEPIGIENLLWARAANSIQEEALELVVGDTILLTRADIIVVLPELLWYLITANTLQ